MKLVSPTPNYQSVQLGLCSELLNRLAVICQKTYCIYVKIYNSQVYVVKFCFFTPRRVQVQLFSVVMNRLYTQIRPTLSKRFYISCCKKTLMVAVYSNHTTLAMNKVQKLLVKLLVKKKWREIGGKMQMLPIFCHLLLKVSFKNE